MRVANQDRRELPLWRRIAMTLLTLMATTCPEIVCAADLSDRDAIALIESKLSRRYPVPVGKVLIVACANDRSPFTSYSDYPTERPFCFQDTIFLERWEKLGVIKTSKQRVWPTACLAKDRSKPFCGHGQMDEITISPTAISEKWVTNSEKPVLFVQGGQYKVTKLVENKSLSGVEGDFRRVAFVADVSYSEPGQSFAKLNGSSLDASQKGVALLRWDKFKSSWSVEAFDAAGSQANFSTNHVRLRTLGLNLK